MAPQFLFKLKNQIINHFARIDTDAVSAAEGWTGGWWVSLPLNEGMIQSNFNFLTLQPRRIPTVSELDAFKLLVSPLLPRRITQSWAFGHLLVKHGK